MSNTVPVARLDMQWYQGSLFDHVLRVVEPTYEITMAEMHVRRTANDTEILLALDQDNGFLTIDTDGADTLLTINVPAGLMSDLVFDNARYDLEIVPDGDDTRRRALLQGHIRLTPEVTRP
jgi:hypothetical protein